MLIQEGMELSTVDVNGQSCTGKVVSFHKNTFVIEHETDYGIERYVISKKKFQKENHMFPHYNENKDFNNPVVWKVDYE